MTGSTVVILALVALVWRGCELVADLAYRYGNGGGPRWR